MTISHRMSDTPLHYVWRAMRQRCRNPKCKSWKYYGARRIKICRQWEEFEAFYWWAMASGYRPGLQLDRKRNNRNYTPSNCRWVTRSVQCQNRRKQLKKSSRYMGVSWKRSASKWTAYVKLHGKQKFLGDFDSEEEAAKARDVFVKVHYDEFATRNF